MLTTGTMQAARRRGGSRRAQVQNVVCAALSSVLDTPPNIAIMLSALRRSSQIALQSAGRSFASSAYPDRKVALLGAAGGIGQPLGLLLKISPYVSQLSLYDIAGTPGVATDISHINSKAKASVRHQSSTVCCLRLKLTLLLQALSQAQFTSGCQCRVSTRTASRKL